MSTAAERTAVELLARCEDVFGVFLVIGYRDAVTSGDDA